METSQLVYFVAVVEERSFTRAARRVQVAQSAVSASVARLERELRTELLDRGWRDVVPTAAGQIVYRQALTVLGCLQNITDELAAQASGLIGTVSVGVVLSTGGLDLPAAVRRFQLVHPHVDIRIELIAGPAHTRLEPVQQGALDLALVTAAHPIPDDVHFTPVTEIQLVLACRAGDPLATRRAVPLEEVAARSFVDFPHTWGNRGVVDELFVRHGVRRRVAVEVPDVATALAFVRADAGVAFLPAEHVAHAGADIVAVDLQDGPTRFVLGVARSAIRPSTAAAQQLFEVLVGAAT